MPSGWRAGKSSSVAEPGATVAALLAAATTRLGAAGVPEPRREARRIWTDLHEERASAIAHDGGRMVDAADREAYGAAVDRRAEGEPLAYVTGLAGFRRLTLRADRRALIPRPETEGLVDLVLARATGGCIVDVGTGTGCVALALADEGRYRLVVGIDRSPAALELARENRRRTGLDVALMGGDLLEATRGEVYDAVVSNPPYLTESEYAGLDGSVRAWEPVGALVSGPDGLAATRRLVRQARGAVRRGGWLALEVDATRAAAVAALAMAAGWGGAEVHMDLFGRARYVLARRSEAE
jgi:release factor glutamine methyltransferase